VPLAHNVRLPLFSREITFVIRNIELRDFFPSHLGIQPLIFIHKHIG